RRCAPFLHFILHQHRVARAAHGDRRWSAHLDHAPRPAGRIFPGVSHAGRGVLSLLEFRRHRVDHALPAHLFGGEGRMRREIRRLVLVWLLLLALGAVEVAASRLSLPRGLRPLIMLPGILMVGVVAVGFMDVRRGPALVRAFAAAGVLWLLIL